MSFFSFQKINSDRCSMLPTAERMVEEDRLGPVSVLGFDDADLYGPVVDELDHRMTRIRAEVARYECDYCCQRFRGAASYPFFSYEKCGSHCSVAQYKAACATNSLCMYCLFLTLPATLAACYIPWIGPAYGVCAGAGASGSITYAVGTPIYCCYYHRCDPKEEE